VSADPSVIDDPIRIEEPNAVTNRKTDIGRLGELGLKAKKAQS
jgi:hypothetical protein